MVKSVWYSVATARPSVCPVVEGGDPGLLKGDDDGEEWKILTLSVW